LSENFLPIDALEEQDIEGKIASKWINCQFVEWIHWLDTVKRPAFISTIMNLLVP
jgi:hypothetical protein